MGLLVDKSQEYQIKFRKELMAKNKDLQKEIEHQKEMMVNVNKMWNDELDRADALDEELKNKDIELNQVKTQIGDLQESYIKLEGQLALTQSNTREVEKQLKTEKVFVATVQKDVVVQIEKIESIEHQLQSVIENASVSEESYKIQLNRANTLEEDLKLFNQNFNELKEKFDKLSKVDLARIPITKDCNNMEYSAIRVNTNDGYMVLRLWIKKDTDKARYEIKHKML